ncbi:excalibur calcium-binding domain-containing protein [Cyanobium sp. ATX-6F1]|uniref:excalibur calcium-binding domain-containing protein n=1 Tax=Cyanobium sp. ATX-6F1 TaxID=3137388 RepID=UPI0039BE300B
MGLAAQRESGELLQRQINWSSPRGALQPSPAQSGGRYRCKEIGSFAKAQELLKQGHSYLDKNGDGVACESLRR